MVPAFSKLAVRLRKQDTCNIHVIITAIHSVPGTGLTTIWVMSANSDRSPLTGNIVTMPIVQLNNPGRVKGL